MSTLLLVRHAQASLFTEDYDRLSELGFAQAEALANFWLARGVRPDRVYTGSMNRQRQTANKVGEVFAKANEPWPAPQENAGLDEYPAEQLTTSLVPALRRTDSGFDALVADLEASREYADKYRSLHRLLSVVISSWILEDYGDADVPVSWKSFSHGVRAALRDMTSNSASGQTIAVFTSGGPIAVSVQTVLQAPDITAADLNWRVHNCSVTRCVFSGERICLDAFNDVAHLPAAMHTYR